MAQVHPPNPKKDKLLSADIAPCDGATLYVCQNGQNEGKRYWAIRRNVNGKYTSIFLGWVDPPGPSLKQKVAAQEELIEKFKKDVDTLKKKVKNIQAGMEDSDE